MLAFDFKPFIAALDTAQKAHLDWSRRILRCAVLHQLPDADICQQNAHLICDLGHFLKEREMVFHTLDSQLLEELIISHITMHDAIRDIAIPLSQGKVGCQIALERFEISQTRVIDLLAHFRTLALNSYTQLDALTNLPLRQKLQQDYSLLQKQLAPERHITLMFLDVDHFKAVNDKYGHSAGDNVLKGLANEAYSILKEDYNLYRYGGEEFVILGSCPSHDQQATFNVAETLRKHIQTTPITITDGQQVSMSATIGVAMAADKEALSSVIERADLAMYKGKERGRNQVVLSQEFTTACSVA